jgi:arylsulfatase A-like enzyme
VRTLGELENTLVCISSDHGDMLGDHNAAAKSKPWEASIGVPLLCFGPGVLQSKIIDFPVTTMDLAATFIDYAGGELASTMTSTSLRPILSGKKNKSQRQFVSSGLDNWRLVIKPYNFSNGTSTWLKYICCTKTCPGSPSNVPKPTNGFTQLLYNVMNDPFDMNNLGYEYDLIMKMNICILLCSVYLHVKKLRVFRYPDVMAHMNKFLPKEYPCGHKDAPGWGGS